MTAGVTRHTLVVQLNDRPGALYRAVGLVRRRHYNVSHLLVGAVDASGTSRMVLVVEAADVQQIVQQLTRLVDVLAVATRPHDEEMLRQFASALHRFDLPSAPPSASSPPSRQESLP